MPTSKIVDIKRRKNVMVHFNKNSITLDYLAILQMFLILLKLNNRVPWNWVIVFLPYIIATLLTLGGAILVALIATLGER